MVRKIRYKDNYGLDFDQVIGWKRLTTGTEDEGHLEVYIPGNKMTFKSDEEGFDYILKTLSEGCGFQPTEHTN